MHVAIHPDDRPVPGAIEIDDIVIERSLTQRGTIEMLKEFGPLLLFGSGHILSQPACTLIQLRIIGDEESPGDEAVFLYIK